jgi:hypothetical protein
MRARDPKRQRARDNDNTPPTTTAMTTTRQRPASPESALANVPANTSLSLQIKSPDDLQRLARLFAASGLFGQGRNPDALMAECAIKILAGMEAGFGPFASAAGVSVINGKPGFGANLLAQAIKRHPTYDYRVVEKTDKICRIKFFSGTEELGVETFTSEMANRARLTKADGMYSKYPEAMLFARCLTAGMRTHCPDALGGSPAYTPEELGAPGQIDEDGMVVATVQDVTPAEPDRDALQAAAIRRLKDCGVTAAGMNAMLAELGGEGCRAIGQLPDDVLISLSKAKVLPETLERWNGASKPVTVRRIDPAPTAVEPQAMEPPEAVEPEPEVIEDEEPMLWAGGEA